MLQVKVLNLLMVYNHIKYVYILNSQLFAIKDYWYFFRFITKTLAIPFYNVKNINFFLLLKKNHKFLVPFVQKQSNTVVFTNKSSLYLSVTKLLIKRFKFLTVKFILDFSTLILKELQGKDLVLMPVKLLIFLKKTKLLRESPFNTTLSINFLFNDTFNYKFSVCDINTQTIYKKIKKAHRFKLTKSKRRAYKINKFFFKQEKFFNISLEQTYFLKKYLSQWLLNKCIFKIKKRFKSKRFSNIRLSTNKNFLLKKNFQLLQFFFYKVRLKILKYTTLLQKTWFKDFKTTIYKTRKRVTSHKKKLKQFSSDFRFFKKRWYNILKYLKLLSAKTTHAKTINPLKYIKLQRVDKFFRKTVFSLNKRIFLTNRLVQHQLLQQYYKPLKSFSTLPTLLNLKTSNTLGVAPKITNLTCLNLDTKLLKILRETRFAHWKLYKTGKLNERRYKNFLTTSIKQYLKNINNQNLLILFFQFFYKIISWQHVNLLVSYNLFTVNGYNPKNVNLKQGDFVEFLINTNQNLLIQWYKQVDKKYYNYMKRWAYLNYCKFVNPELKKKKIYLNF